MKASSYSSKNKRFRLFLLSMVSVFFLAALFVLRSDFIEIVVAKEFDKSTVFENTEKDPSFALKSTDFCDNLRSLLGCEKANAEKVSREIKICINNDACIKPPINSALLRSFQIGLFERHSMSAATLDANTNTTDTFHVSTSEELQDALANATGGETILLEGGEWGGFGLSDFDPTSTVTIKSADPENPAVFSKLWLSNASNIEFDGVTFDYTFSEGDDQSVKPFQVLDSENVTFRNSVFDGDDASGVSEKSDGYGWGFGLWVRESSGVSLLDSEMYDFHRGAIFYYAEDVTVTNNDIHNMSSDGLDFAAVKNVTIEDNYLHDFDAHPDTGAHKDMIQFWTRGTYWPSENVVIRNNTLDQGDGVWTQSIFIRNEEVDSLGAGEDMYYKNFVIEDNVIINSHIHGIRVGETDGLTISNNTVVSKEDSSDPIATPIINLSGSSKNVLVENNVTEAEIKLNEESHSSSGNIIVQASNPEGENYAGDFFADYFSENLEAKDLAVVATDLPNPTGADVSDVAGKGHAAATVGEGREAFTVSYSLSEDALEGAASVEWLFSDGTTKSGSETTYTYSEAGTQTATARVTYENGETSEIEKAVVLRSPNYLKVETVDGVTKDVTDLENSVNLGSNVAVKEIDGKDGLTLNGDTVKIGASKDFFYNKQFSVSFDIAFESSESGGGRVLNFASSFVMFMTPNSISLALTTDAGATWLKSPIPALSADEWNSVTFTFNSDTGVAALYLNGEKLTEVGGLEGQVQLGDPAHGLILGDPFSDSDQGISYSDFTFVGYELTEDEVNSGQKVAELGGPNTDPDTDTDTGTVDPAPVDTPDPVTPPSDDDPVVEDDEEADSEDNALYGSDADDTMFAGSSEGQIVFGKAGNDTIATYGGNDTLIGGEGSDKLLGGDGDDILVADASDSRLDGGTGFDRLRFSESLEEVDMRTFSAYIQGIEAIDIENESDQKLTVDHRDADRIESADGLFIFADEGDTVVFDDSSFAISVEISGQREIDGNLFNVFVSTRYKAENTFYVDADASVYNSQGELLSPLETGPLFSDEIIA